MATQLIKNYHVLFYGSPDGYQTNRAQISLYGEDNKVKAYLRFNDANMTFENDYESGGIIRMHLPSDSFENVMRTTTSVCFREANVAGPTIS